MTALAIEATGLVKTFGQTRAVDGVDLSVRRGCIYGVLGPNGAGKTTTIRMLATLIRPDAGSARVLGHDIVAEAEAVRSVVSLTGGEYLRSPPAGRCVPPGRQAVADPVELRGRQAVTVTEPAMPCSSSGPLACRMQ